MLQCLVKESSSNSLKTFSPWLENKIQREADFSGYWLESRLVLLLEESLSLLEESWRPLRITFQIRFVIPKTHTTNHKFPCGLFKLHPWKIKVLIRKIEETLGKRRQDGTLEFYMKCIIFLQFKGNNSEHTTLLSLLSKKKSQKKELEDGIPMEININPD